MNREILRIENMTVSSGGRRCLQNVDFNLFQGELLAVTGLNNAGKGLLAAAIAGRAPFTASRIYRDEQALEGPAQYAACAQDIFYISRESQLFDDFTVAENLFALERRQLLALFSGRRCAARARALLAHLGLSIDPDLPARSLPLAQKHLVAICRALALGARILILDRLASQYGPGDFSTLSALLSRLEGVSVVYLSRQPDPILLQAGRVLLLRGSTVAGLFYRGCFQPELLLHPAEKPAGPEKPLPPPAAAAPCLLRLETPDLSLRLQPGQALLVLDGRDSARRALLSAFLSPAPGSLFVQDKPMADYGAAVQAGLAVLPELNGGGLPFPCLTEGENLAFQVLKKTSGAGLVSRRVLGYAQSRCREALSTPACLENPAWRSYKLRLCAFGLAHSRVYVLEDPAANMDAVLLTELLELLRSLLDSGCALLILASQAENYAALRPQVLDLAATAPASDTPGPRSPCPPPGA